MKAIGRYFIPLLGLLMVLTTAEMKASSPTAHYWIDHDKIIEGTSQLSGSLLNLDIDVSEYPGAHTLYYRIQDLDGKWSTVTCVPFVSLVSGGDAVCCEYWIDKDYDLRQKVAVADNNAVFDIDCESLASGAHFLYYRVENESGNYGGVMCHVFCKTPASDNRVKWYRYWWNDRYDLATEVPVEAQEPVFMLDADLLIPDYALDADADIHRATLNIMFGDEEGNVSEILVAEVDYEPYILSVVDVDVRASWNYHSTRNELTLTGLTPGEGLVRIFTPDGQLLFSAVPETESLVYSTEKNSIVIVCYNGVSRKILLR